LNFTLAARGPSFSGALLEREKRRQRALKHARRFFSMHLQDCSRQTKLAYVYGFRLKPVCDLQQWMRENLLVAKTDSSHEAVAG